MFDLLNKIDSWVQNGPMGNDKQFLGWGTVAQLGIGLDVGQ